jgi:uncharacterized protein (DUF2141 family)
MVLSGYHRIFNVILAVFMALPISVLAQDTCVGSIKIVLTNLQNKTGSVEIGVYGNPEGWPYNPEYNFVFKKDSLVNRSIVFTVDSISCGSRAISVLDDENENHSMDYNVIGIPKEGWGFSNNPSFLRLKEPPFEECAFNLSNGTEEVPINMNYISGNNKSKL